ncbi:hypothetical protein PMIN02_011422 [Paraphaeosphaeria minitans]
MSNMNKTVKAYGDNQVLHVRDHADQVAFYNMVKDDAALEKFQEIRKLVIHLDARQLMLSDEDRLVMALNRLHPLREGVNVTNPHKIETICFVVDSDILFTRFNYALTSPTIYNNKEGRYSELLNNKVAPAKKKKIVFQVTSTEKLIAPALLGLRHIKNVTFNTNPRPCKLEGGFREMLELTLPCIPALIGHIPAPSHQSLHSYATVGFDREGNFRSAAYNADPNINPYEDGEQFDAAHIDPNDRYTLYNMVAINKQDSDKMKDGPLWENDNMPSELQDLHLGWKV